MTVRRRRLALALASAVVLGACQPPRPPESDPVASPACGLTLAAQARVVSDYMSSAYYWNANLATPDPRAPDIGAWFDSLLYRPIDRYSFSEPSLVHEQRTALGVRVGYGYSLAWDEMDPTRLRVRFVEPRGPAARAGLRRGDTVRSIDGLTSGQIGAGELPAVVSAGVSRVFVVLGTDGQQRVLEVESQEFALSLVPAVQTFDLRRPDGTPVRVGYLAYQAFAGHGHPDLGAAMTRLAGAGITDLVLDLRYNGGGSIAVARDLASMIGGSRTAWRLFAYLRYNGQQLVHNQSFVFQPPEPGLLPGPALERLERLVVLVSGATASASELVINGLRPFLPVTLAGATTYGKPYGSIPRELCGTTFHAIHFTTLNAQGEGGYDRGLAPDCPVPDDLDHDLGDPAERRLAAALDFIRTGSCPRAPLQALPRQAPRPPVPGEDPPPAMSLR